MPTKRQLEAMQLYANLMEEVKIRIDALNFFLTGRLPIPSQIVRESGFLQLRMLCELIAIGCLIAHGDIQEVGSKRMRKQYSPEKIFSVLEGLHPNFYPQPARQDDSGPTRQLIGTKPQLPKADLLRLNGKCGDILHRGGLKKFLAPRMPQDSDLIEIAGWGQKINDMPNLHVISLLDEKTQFVCLLKNALNANRVQTLICTMN